MRFRQNTRSNFRRAASIAEYVIILAVIASCSVAVYFSTLVTGAEYAGKQLCTECPDDYEANREPWNKWKDKAEKQNQKKAAAEKSKQQGSSDKTAEPEDKIPETTSSADDSTSIAAQEARIPQQYLSYMVDNWFSWLWV